MVVFWKRNFLLCVLIELQYEVISELLICDMTVIVLGMHEEIVAKI